MLKHLVTPAIFLGIAASVVLIFSCVEPTKRDTVAYESPQAAISASFK